MSSLWLRWNKRLTFEAHDDLLKDKKYFGEKWHDFSLETQDEIVEFLLDSEDENAIYEKAGRKSWIQPSIEVGH